MTPHALHSHRIRPMPTQGLNTPPPDARTTRLLWFAFALFTFTCAFFHVSDADVGYHIRTGEHILATGRIPDRNTFSFAIPDAPWTLQQWWPATMYSIVWSQGGLGALITFKALLATAIMLVALAAARREAGPGSLWPFWVMTVIVFIARVRFFERPDLVTALLFALLLLVDARKERERAWQWIGVPLLMAFWGNTHAGYIYGFVLLCCWSAAEWIEWIWRGRRNRPRVEFRELFVRPVGIALAGAAAVIATQVINPSGYRVLLVPIEQFLDTFWRAVIQEYLPPAWATSKLFYLAVATLVVVQLVSWQRVKLRFLVPTLAFGYLACATQRSMLVFLIVAAPHAAFMLDRLATVRGEFLHWAQKTLLAPAWLALALVATQDRTHPFGVGLHPAFYPASVFRFMEAEVPPQRVFNEMRFGGSMLWWLWPRFPPFIDGRGDAYPTEFWRSEYHPVLMAGAEWRALLRKHQTHAVLLPIVTAGEMPGLAKALKADPAWALVAFNESALLFLERTATNQPVVAKHEFRHLWPGDWTFANVTPDSSVPVKAEAQRALGFAPDSVFAQTALARASLVAGEFELAARLLNELTRRPGSGENYWRDLGFALTRLGRIDEAERVFSHMIREGFARGYPWFMKFHIQLQRGSGAEADRCLTEALKAEPLNPEYLAARRQFDAAIKK